MKLTKGKIILAIIVIYFAVMGLININKHKGNNELILDDVVLVTDGKVNPKNEGKLVLVTGFIDYENDVTFLELENPIPSFKVKREVYDYKETVNSAGSKSTGWVERTSIEEDILTGDYMDTICSETVTEPITVGEFKLNDEGMEKIKPAKRLLDKNIEVGGLKFEGLSYTTSGDDENESLGDMKVIYEYFDVDKIDTLSILAKQVGDSFESYELGSGDEVYNVYEGRIDSMDGLKEALNTDVKKSSKGKILFILMIVGIGVVLILDSKKNDGEDAK